MPKFGLSLEYYYALKKPITVTPPQNSRLTDISINTG